MIRESLHFWFNGRKSTDFGIINVSIGDGLFNEQVTPSKTINEAYIPGREEPYFYDVTEEPTLLQLRFSFLEPWNDKLIDEVIRWLNVDYYSPLYFEGNIDRVYYVIPVDGISKMHNGLKQGFLELNMRCNSGRSYSKEIITPTYNTQELAQKQSIDSPIIKIGNRGHYPTYPKIWIEKIDHGDIVIINRTNGGSMFKFENIDVGENLYIDCRNEIIETDKEDAYRYDDFNDNYLELIYGENVLNVSNNMKIRFGIKYIFS